ncbi:MAG: site-specific integrase, partial [Oscillospiraceae bacterium]
MSERILSLDNLQDYTQYLIEEERSNATIEKYERDIGGFAHFLGATQAVSKERVLEYKEQLVARYATSSVNSMLTAINGILHYFGFHDCCVKLL